MGWSKPTRRRSISCDDTREAISARLDNEDGPLTSRQINRHLDACPDCRRFHQAWHASDSPLARITRQERIRTPKPAPPQLAAIAATRRTPSSNHTGASTPRPAPRGPSRALAGRTLMVATPVVAAIVALQMGLPGHVKITPTHQPTPCTQHLHHVGGPPVMHHGGLVLDH